MYREEEKANTPIRIDLQASSGQCCRRQTMWPHSGCIDRLAVPQVFVSYLSQYTHIYVFMVKCMYCLLVAGSSVLLITNESRTPVIDNIIVELLKKGKKKK